MFAVLIDGNAPHFDDALIRLRARRRDFEDFAFDAQRVARTHGPGPRNFSAQANHSASERQPSSDHQSHRRSRRMPAACGEPAKNTALGSRFVQMKRLRIKFRGERFHPIFIHLIQPE